MIDEHIERGREYLAEVKDGIKKALYVAQANYKLRQKAKGLCILCKEVSIGIYCKKHRAYYTKYYRDERARKKVKSTKEIVG